MDNKKKLDEIAEEIRNGITKPSDPQTAVVTNVNKEIDEDELVINGIGLSATTAEDTHSMESDTSDKPISLELTEADLRAEMPDVDADYFKKVAPEMLGELTKYARSLVVEYGMTPTEAREAANTRMKKNAYNLQKEWLEEHPKQGIVEINKRDADKLEFTPEERSKLQKSKIIRMVEVEDVRLKTLNIKTVDRDIKAKYINEAKGSLTQDAVPLISMSDYVTFQGVQVLRLYSTCMFEDDTLIEALAKKASILYDAYVGGLNHSKKDDDGKEMSYQDFLNFFPYFDMDMALFSILCASSPEQTTAHFSCRRCRGDIPKTYNVRSILHFDGVADAEKERIDKLIANHTDAEFMKEMQSPLVDGKRFESIASSNIFDVKIPSIAKAMSILQYVDKDNEYELGLFSTVVFIDTIYLKDAESDSYIKYTSDEPDLFWSACRKLPQEDLDAVFLIKQEHGRLAIPTFEMDIDCVNPDCKHHMHNQFNIDQLIFQRAQDLPVGIELSKN